MDDWVREIVLDREAEEESDRELRIKIRELPMADGVFASTGCQLWSASIVLAQELLRRPQLVAGKKVVEVGAGCGLLGITIATLARRTLITDGDEEVVRLLSHNLKANETCWRSKEGEEPREASTQVLKWEDVVAGGWPAEERAEVVIASDIIAGMFGNVVAQAFLKILAPGGFIMLNAHEDRTSSIRGFRDHLLTVGFRVSESTHTSAYGNFRTYECWERTPPVSSKAPPAEPPSMQPAELPPAVAAAPAEMHRALSPPPPPPPPVAAEVKPPPPPPSAAEEAPCRPLPPPPAAAPEPADAALAKQQAVPMEVVEPSSKSFWDRLEMFQHGGSGGYEPDQDLRVTARPMSWFADQEPWSQPEASAPKGMLSKPRFGGMDFDGMRALDELVIAPADSKIVWHVTGGMKHSGLMVRSGCSLDHKLSSITGRLSHGALVREVERTALRLHFVRISGEGPDKGWVSLFSKQGTPLVERVCN